MRGKKKRRRQVRTEVEKTPVVRATQDVRAMDRKTLKGVIADLKGAGVDIKFSKTDDDPTLQRKVNEALAGLPSPEILHKLERVNPQKLAQIVGQKDCLGIFVDLTAAECLICSDKQECVKEYLKNLSGNFKMLDAALDDVKTEEQAKQVPKEVINAVAKKAKKAAKEKEPQQRIKPITYNPKTAVYVMDVENPNKEDSEAYAAVQAVLDQVPGTMLELRECVASEYVWESDEDFIEECVGQMRQIGVIKLHDDLTAEELAAYEEALAAANGNGKRKGKKARKA